MVFPDNGPIADKAQRADLKLKCDVAKVAGVALMVIGALCCLGGPAGIVFGALFIAAGAATFWAGHNAKVILTNLGEVADAGAVSTLRGTLGTNPEKWKKQVSKGTFCASWLTDYVIDKQFAEMNK